MLRITRQTDYGVVLLAHLATHPERSYNAPELAAEAAIPLPMAGKVLKALTRSGLLRSQRGVAGGYQLARPAAAITVAEILTALEGPVALTDCIAHGPGECHQARGCPSRLNWEHINQAVLAALEGVSLADMTGPTRPPAFDRPIAVEMLLPVVDAGPRAEER
jgi:FeS assembly SUF system regulator